jgi:hydroxyacylglutathione hydrolase
MPDAQLDLIVTPLPAFKDNYLWLLTRGNEAAIVDPGDAEPVMRALDDRRLSLVAILATHHHADHVGGVMRLKERYSATVYGPARESIAGVDHRLQHGDRIEVLRTQFRVIDIPGHTAGHIAYFAEAHKPPILFCGDTLFACGCGRLFEGTPEQMLASLDALAALPAATRVYCGHEYTVANIRFALEVEPNNRELQTRAATATAMRRRGEPTLPSTIGLELATNPFLRSDTPSVRAAASGISHGAGLARVSTFAAIRKWKDGFT